MNSDLKSALDFAIGYGSVENLEKDYKFQRRIYRVITLIELVICGVILAIKFHLIKSGRENLGLLEDLLEGTSAVADTLDKGSQALRQGQEGIEYTKERLDWAKSDRPKKDRAACADIRRKMDSMRRRYIFLWILIIVGTVVAMHFL